MSSRDRKYHFLYPDQSFPGDTHSVRASKNPNAIVFDGRKYDLVRHVQRPRAGMRIRYRGEEGRVIGHPGRDLLILVIGDQVVKGQNDNATYQHDFEFDDAFPGWEELS